MRKRIVYTRHDGGVSICTPADECLKWMACGGYWAAMPRGFIEIQIERNIEAGVRPDDARRYVHALAFGGCSEHEALAIIRDRDCVPHGTAHELTDPEDLPSRWFRDAWVRSHNGGPIDIDLEAARPIQWDRISRAVMTEGRKWNGVRRNAENYRSRIEEARSLDELRAVWPEGVPQ